ncbi:MAG: MurT ligase domain-containing protein [bacterium]
MLNKIFNREGDVLPAYILKKIDKNIFDDFAGYVASSGIPVIMVTGTNGKTTTANLIAEALRASGKSVCSNSNGANMANGIFGAIIGAFKFSGLSGLAGSIVKFPSDFIVIESDEKVFPYIAPKLDPDVVVITNFYRDQLDRYGEVNSTVFEIKKTVKNLPGDPVLILPSFEPLASFTGYGLKNRKIYYGFNKDFFQETYLTEGVLTDALTCPECGAVLSTGKELNKNALLLNFKCEKCGFANPNSDVYAAYNSPGVIKIISHNEIGSGAFVFKPVLTGDYNVANYLAAYSVLKNFEIGGDIIKYSFENFETKFGRSFKKTVKDFEINIDLVKNPTGFNRVLEKITGNRAACTYPVNILFAFSDRDADGRDVSWIWDVEFEKYIHNIGKIVITGLRPFDLAVRLKTAGVDKSNITVEHNLKKAVKKIFQVAEERKRSFSEANPADKKIYILPTYTELLRLKKYII